MGQGFQAFISDAEARVGDIAARAPWWAIDIIVVVLAVLVALACHAILMAAARRAVDARGVSHIAADADPRTHPACPHHRRAEYCGGGSPARSGDRRERP